ncbi:hypothetical protein IFM89_003043 [Coptis chinensis]|uniref:Uncharacterized protein n=1 Tax=Coptis chinensis TaxID=261450 RepID=A0A835IU58_9MAGN|nr:hypothetical protein IFM89_003043 [Coptis chinensis]
MSVCGVSANNVLGLIHVTTTPKLPFSPQRLRLSDSNNLSFTSRNIISTSVRYSAQFKCSASLGRNQPESRGLKLLVVFLVEQPGQLKYIEWPSFQSTLKTATLTLVLVAMLIVALSSVDSALSFLLALLLRKSA